MQRLPLLHTWGFKVCAMCHLSSILGGLPLVPLMLRGVASKGSGCRARAANSRGFEGGAQGNTCSTAVYTVVQEQDSLQPAGLC